MIIGFLGKGGSGKSTLATLFTFYLVNKNKSVLAIDADYNMDLTDNLGFEGEMNYVGQAYSEVLSYMEIDSLANSLSKESPTYFSLSPIDSFTEKYSTPVRDNLRLMIAGPHTETMLRGGGCGHGLTQALKLYLPFIKVKENEAVVVDEKAGTDGVGTGITNGFTSAVVVVEATKHGIKAAKQISQMLHFYNTPYVYVLNKTKDETMRKEAEKELGSEAVISIPFSEDFAFKNTTAYEKELETLYVFLQKTEDTRRRRLADHLQMQNEVKHH